MKKFFELLTLPSKYDTYLNSIGVKTAVFNPLKLKMSSKYNNRNHRKIAIIDGTIGYTGGCNIADEYINNIEKRGHWKDAAIRLHGDAVWSLTVMFLTMWDYIQHTTSDYNNLYPPALTDQIFPEIGLVQPFSDNPLDLEPVGNHIYLNLINRAEKYIYIKTPYLIIDHGLYTALSLAAKSGVEVIIITPVMVMNGMYMKPRVLIIKCLLKTASVFMNTHPVSCMKNLWL